MNKLITERQQAFLDAYRYSGMVKEAAETIGRSREMHYGAMRTSDAYREAFALVQSDVAVELEEEARRRAVDGVKVPILYRGKVIGYDTRRSDALLIFLLEANNPEKFAGIKEELGRNKDFGVRWDREEVGRPTLSRMTGPLPPMPPRPPRPPQPPVGEWGWDEVLEGVADVGTAARPEPDPELIRRWAAMDLSEGPYESGLRNAPPQKSDAADEESAAEIPFDVPFEMEECEESGENDDGFCVRWEETEHDPREMASTPLLRPRAFRRASTHPAERPFEEIGDSDARLCVRWGRPDTTGGRWDRHRFRGCMRFAGPQRTRRNCGSRRMARSGAGAMSVSVSGRGTRQPGPLCVRSRTVVRG